MCFAFLPLFFRDFYYLHNTVPFYFDANQQQCFNEELPTDTVKGERQTILSTNPCIYLEIGQLWSGRSSSKNRWTTDT